MKKLICAIFLVATITSCKKDDNEPNGSNPSPSHPVSMKLESIVLNGFSQTNSSGSYWDSNTNAPDIYVNIFKGGALVFTSEDQISADHNASYVLDTPVSGSLPIVYTDDTELKIEVRDSDSSTTSDNDFMGAVDIEDALNFFYNGNGATEFSELELVTSNGLVTLLVSGTFQY